LGVEKLLAASFLVSGTWMLKKLSSVSILAACSLALSATCLAQPQHQPSASRDNPLAKFLRKYLPEPYPAFEREGATRYSSVPVDLKDDGSKEVIVYISGRGWCGSGGCRMLILYPEGGSYRVVTETTITRLPIRVLATKSNGWHDISVVVAGGGIRPGYEAVLSFDGKTYPGNPSVPPARRLEGEVEGKTVMPSTAEGMPLYQ
jgi:hypothetical protein